MLFNTTRFFIFLAVVLALFYALPQRVRKYLLLAASYFFYASWNPRFIALLLTLTAIDFTAGLWLQRSTVGGHRRISAAPAGTANRAPGRVPAAVVRAHP